MRGTWPSHEPFEKPGDVEALEEVVADMCLGLQRGEEFAQSLPAP